MKLGLFILLILTSLSIQSQSYEDRIENILIYAEIEGKNQIKSTFDSLNLALQLALKNEDDLIASFVLSSLQRHVLQHYSNYEKALEYANSIKEIAEANPESPILKARYHSSLGLLYYYEFTDKDRAFIEFEKALQILLDNHITPDYHFLNNYAIAYMQYGKQQKAIELLKKAADNYAKYEGFFKNPIYPFTNYSNLGVSYIYENADSAEHYLRLGLKYAEENLSYDQVFSGNVFLGVFLQEQMRLDEAIYYLQKAKDKKFTNSSISHQLLLYEALSDAYYLKKDFQRAFEYAKAVSAYKDSIRLKGIEEKVLAHEYQMELKALQNRQVLHLAKEEIKQAALKRNIAVLSSIFLICITMILFYLYRLTKEKELNRIKAENEALEKEKIRHQSELVLLKKEEQLISANVELSVMEKELSSLKEKLTNHLNKSHDPAFNDLREFLNQIKYSTKKSDKLKKMDSVLSINSNRFYKGIKEKHPNLSEDEIRLATLIRLNLGTEELLLIYNISKSSLNTKRYRIRKKIGLDGKQSLEEYIMNI
ncbi:MAG: hypothetical protein JJT77_05635 [Crocinitomicaceae bacterium]|nr:hypothetical protein [Crocinitomicaceae bacterium]